MTAGGKKETEGLNLKRTGQSFSNVYPVFLLLAYLLYVAHSNDRLALTEDCLNGCGDFRVCDIWSINMLD